MACTFAHSQDELREKTCKWSHEMKLELWRAYECKVGFWDGSQIFIAFWFKPGHWASGFRIHRNYANTVL